MLLMLLNCDEDGATEKNLEPQLPLTSCTEQAGSSTYQCFTAIDGLERRFNYYLPPVYFETSNDLPILISLHGGGGTAEENQEYTNLSILADEENFIPVFPQGSVAEGKGTTGWFTGSCDGSEVCDIGFVSHIIDYLGLNMNVNLDEVYVTGFSNGAFMAYSLACNLSEKIAAVAPIAGSMENGNFQTCYSTHPLSIVHIHGATDNVIPNIGNEYFEPVRDVIDFWKDFNECSQIVITDGKDNNNDGYIWGAETHIDCLYGVEVEYVNLGGFGHEWPSSTYTKEPADIDASSYIWSFLSRYDINGIKK